MVKYIHLRLEERTKICLLHLEDKSLREISRTLGRSVSTISRELRRNSTFIGHQRLYLADSANNAMRKRRPKGRCKIADSALLRKLITTHLQYDKWSPEAISGRLKLCHKLCVSVETIYKYIYSAAGRKLQLYKHLMYQRPARMVQCSRRHRYKIADKHMICNRPDHINERTTFGHFEADLTFFKGSQSQNLLVLVERLTRQTFIIFNPNKRAIGNMNRLTSFIKSLPMGLVKSITMDNGSEFKRYGSLSLMDIEAYFCKPSSPWEKGQVERTNALLHKFLPKRRNIKEVSAEEILQAQNKLNHLPRKVLNFLTPHELWNRYHHNDGVALQP